MRIILLELVIIIIIIIISHNILVMRFLLIANLLVQGKVIVDLNYLKQFLLLSILAVKSIKHGFHECISKIHAINFKT